MTDLDHLFVRRQVTRLLAPWQQHADGPGVTIGVVLGREVSVTLPPHCGPPARCDVLAL
jgi:hypothetical protein